MRFSFACGFIDIAGQTDPALGRYRTFAKRLASFEAQVLQVAADVAQFEHCRLVEPGVRTQAMLDVLMNECMRCATDSQFDGVKLPRDVRAIATRLDHANCFAKVMVRAVQSKDDVRMRRMEGSLAHGNYRYVLKDASTLGRQVLGSR
jgi:hypothetical protein